MDNIIVKTKITTPDGSVYEFEGPQSFVEAQIDKIESKEKPGIPLNNSPHPQAAAPAKRAPTRKNTEQPKMLPDLVTEAEDVKNLRTFFHQKNPSSQMEAYAVLAYWLKNKANRTKLTIDEIWTLYKILGDKPPKVLVQPFRDGKARKGYFEAGDTTGEYTLTPFGETIVEHDLPRTETND